MYSVNSNLDHSRLILRTSSHLPIYSLSMSDQRREFIDQRYVYFLTFSVYRRRRLLDFDHPKRIVLGILNHQLEQMQGKCVGFVIMPDHVPALLWLTGPARLTALRSPLEANEQLRNPQMVLRSRTERLSRVRTWGPVLAAEVLLLSPQFCGQDPREARIHPPESAARGAGATSCRLAMELRTLVFAAKISRSAN